MIEILIMNATRDVIPTCSAARPGLIRDIIHGGGGFLRATVVLAGCRSFRGMGGNIECSIPSIRNSIRRETIGSQLTNHLVLPCVVLYA